MIYTFDIEIHPTTDKPLPQPKLVDNKKKVKKWRWPWRINALATPKLPICKYVAPPIGPDKFKVYGPVEPNVAFRADHLARPFIRILYENKRIYYERGTKYVKIVTKNIEKSWDAIYNYYRKRLRARRLKMLKRKLEKLKAKKPKGKDAAKIEELRLERRIKLATPKKLFLPPKIKRKRRELQKLLPNLYRLAAPKEREVPKPKEIGVVSKSALQYHVSEGVLKLYNLVFDRMKKYKIVPVVLGKVSRGALRAKCSERVEKLAQPSLSRREAKKKDEDAYDPWVISKTALKYKPSARILELAKPLERD